MQLLPNEETVCTLWAAEGNCESQARTCWQCSSILQMFPSMSRRPKFLSSFWYRVAFSPTCLALTEISRLTQNKFFQIKKKMIKLCSGKFFIVVCFSSEPAEKSQPTNYGGAQGWGIVCRGNTLHQLFNEIWLEVSMVYWVQWNKPKWALCLCFFLSFFRLLLPSATRLCFHLFSFK